MTPTEADIAKARELLPCNCGYEIPDEYGHGFTHSHDCPATRRPAFATALSQARAEGREEAARWHDERAAQWGDTEKGFHDIGFVNSSGAARENAKSHGRFAAAIRSLKP